MNRGWLKSLVVVGQRREAVVLTVMTVAVVASLALALAGMTWRLAGLNDGRDHIARVLEPAASRRATEVAPILALAPFGGVVADTQASVSGMTLKAIFMAYPAEASSALIAVGDAPATVVHPGEALSGGALIQSIAVDHVVLQVSGQAERLEFPKPVDASGGEPASPGADGTPPSEQPQTGSAAAANSAASP
jgi:general secretion pathway protein C